MNKVISLEKHRKDSLRKKGKQSTLCGNDFHSWAVVKDKAFDVRQGRLVTQYRCKRCGATKTVAQ